MPIPETENGSPTLRGVVPLDIIAKTSGVNPAAVARVLVALELLSEEFGVDLDELTDPYAIPLAPPNLTRYTATEKMWVSIAQRWQNRSEGRLLHLREKLQKHQSGETGR